jgi:hypothetical protein
VRAVGLSWAVGQRLLILLRLRLLSLPSGLFLTLPLSLLLGLAGLLVGLPPGLVLGEFGGGLLLFSAGSVQ